MEFQAVASSTISGVNYNNKTSVLTIEFKNGSKYEYRGVPEDDYEGLMSASSAGSFFHDNIKNTYPAKRI